MPLSQHYDFIIIGSGFGGSVSALRLSEKGYKVLVLEKGRRFEPKDFPKTNRDVRNWMWLPQLGFKGIFQMSFLQHVTILHGVGVGGGSLTYANTLPTPKDAFFEAGSWGHLADWKNELAPHYETALKMLGAEENPRQTPADDIMEEIAEDLGRKDHFEKTRVAVYFGEPGKKVEDPYFDGKGPDRVGCTHCGACMTGCRVGAKNTLDRNYLHLAEQLGCEILPETEATMVFPRDDGGYQIETKGSFGGPKATFTADKVIFSGGVMGTIPLLLSLKETGLPKLSERLGDMVRTNSEALIGVISPEIDKDLSEGVAITSIIHTDEHSHVEPVRYGSGSDFFRIMVAPHAPGETLLQRVAGTMMGIAKQPLRWAKAFGVKDFPKQTQILLYMRTLDGTLKLRLGRHATTGFRRSLVSKLDDPTKAPTAFMEEATDLANRFAEKVKGVSMTLLSETVMGTPSTAHILGGACMGETPADGVIDHQHRVFGYDGLYVIDGAAMSANPGVNPSLTITALAERAMGFIPAKSQA